MNDKHIILIGFKSVGKSSVARALAKTLQKNLIDLDQEIEGHQQNTSCREIVKQHGEEYFREMETKLLERVLKNPPAVIALGGGAVLSIKNRELIKHHKIIHITASKDKVYERILAQGRPAYYDPKSEIKEIFNELWELRSKIYQELACVTVENNDIENTALEIVKKLNEKISKKILVLHGPNLNLLGTRDIAEYGSWTLAELENYIRSLASGKGYAVNCYQSNSEGQLIDFLQAKAASHSGIIINPGAFSHYSYALHDALLDTRLPVVEVHLSNLAERELWRQHSVTAAACLAKIFGKKWQGYAEALELLLEHLEHDEKN